MLEKVLAALNDRGLRLRHRLRRRPHADHHGPLRGQLADGRAGLAAPTCRASGRQIRLCQGGHRDLPRRDRLHRSGSARLRDRARTASLWRRSPTATASSSSTSAATARRRFPWPLTARTSTTSTAGDYTGVKFAGMLQYDGDLKIPQHYLVQPARHQAHPDRGAVRRTESTSTPCPRPRSTAM